MKRDKSYSEELTIVKKQRSEIIFGVRGHNPREFDQFFTKPEVSEQCIKSLSVTLKNSLDNFDVIIEPSFGDGSFVKVLEGYNIYMPKLIFIDIDAKEVSHRADFLKADDIIPKTYQNSLSDLSDVKSSPICLTIGNPPFGKNSSLAISFFNRAAQFSACIAFILPRTFSKASVQAKLDRHYFLVYEENLPREGFVFNCESYDVPCVFQVWIHIKHIDLVKLDVLEQAPMKLPFKGGCCSSSLLRPLPMKLSETSDFIFLSSRSHEIPDLAIRRVGVNAGRIFTENPQNCSQQSHHFLLIKDRSRCADVIEKLKALDLEEEECKFQTAGNPSISKSELCLLYMEAMNK